MAEGAEGTQGTDRGVDRPTILRYSGRTLDYLRNARGHPPAEQLLSRSPYDGLALCAGQPAGTDVAAPGGLRSTLSVAGILVVNYPEWKARVLRRQRQDKE